MIRKQESVIEQLVKGDKSTFEKVFHEYFPRLYRFAFDFVKDRDIARELTHETFVKLWVSRTNLDPSSNLNALLYTICQHQCLNFLKHKKVLLKFQELHQNGLDNLEAQSEILNDYNFNRLDLEHLEKKTYQSIQSLPEQCRLVFELSRFKNLKYSEIATTLHISVKTVEGHITLALKKLREDLKDFL